MAVKGISIGVLFIMLVSLVVVLVELFLPISTKIEMNIACRATMMEMEMGGGLNGEDKELLQQRLIARGLSNINIIAPDALQYGQELNLLVEADYSYSKFIHLFERDQATQHMVYDKTTICRRVCN